jgi:hypothetical protein
MYIKNIRDLSHYHKNVITVDDAVSVNHVNVQE